METKKEEKKLSSIQIAGIVIGVIIIVAIIIYFIMRWMKKENKIEFKKQYGLGHGYFYSKKSPSKLYSVTDSNWRSGKLYDMSL